MDLFILLITILQILAISLGVGASTLAIVNFFVAIADGKIDDTERRMMGVVYVVLRVAMVTILLTSLTLIALQVSAVGLTNLPVFSYSVLLVLGVLFLNAILMTARIMPSTFGPSLQAGSWYALGVIPALIVVGVTNFSFVIFVMCYITWLVLATGIVNGIMAFLRARKQNAIT